MGRISIKDIYAGMPDAKDEIDTNQLDLFLGSFVVPPALPIESILEGKNISFPAIKE